MLCNETLRSVNDTPAISSDVIKLPTYTLTTFNFIASTAKGYAVCNTFTKTNRHRTQISDSCICDDKEFQVRSPTKVVHYQRHLHPLARVL